MAKDYSNGFFDSKEVGNQEVWKFHPTRIGYEFSSDGRARSYWMPGHPILKDSPKLLKPYLGNRGYYVCHAGRDGIVVLHHLILETFVGPRPILDGEPAWGRHLNDNPLDNRAKNLAWGTQEDNIADAKRNGKWVLGSKRKFAKANEEIAVEIQKMYEDGTTQRELAKKYNLSVSIIQSICAAKRCWSHVGRMKKPASKIEKWMIPYIKEQRDSGRTFRSLSGELGLHDSTIGRLYRDEYKIPKNKEIR